MISKKTLVTLVLGTGLLISCSKSKENKNSEHDFYYSTPNESTRIDTTGGKTHKYIADGTKLLINPNSFDRHYNECKWYFTAGAGTAVLSFDKLMWSKYRLLKAERRPDGLHYEMINDRQSQIFSLWIDNDGDGVFQNMSNLEYTIALKK